MMFIILLLLLLFPFEFSVEAHPVAYAGAFSFMSLNSNEMSENTLVYSPKYWLGTGIKHVQRGDKKWTNFHLGYLVKRWNELESQGNIYLFGGPGRFEENEKNVYFTKYGVQVDWETRRIYTLIRYTSSQSKLDSTENYEGRIGFAPYLAEYDELNAWLILQVQHSPQAERETTFTPLLRLFYKNTLLEMGSSLRNKWLLNFMVRY